jgi:hypothetical protein
MPAEPEAENPENLGNESRESIKKVRDLVGEMKIVQEHENAILGDNPAPPVSH